MAKKKKKKATAKKKNPNAVALGRRGGQKSATIPRTAEQRRLAREALDRVRHKRWATKKKKSGKEAAAPPTGRYPYVPPPQPSGGDAGDIHPLTP